MHFAKFQLDTSYHDMSGFLCMGVTKKGTQCTRTATTALSGEPEPSRCRLHRNQLVGFREDTTEATGIFEDCDNGSPVRGIATSTPQNTPPGRPGWGPTRSLEYRLRETRSGECRKTQLPQSPLFPKETPPSPTRRASRRTYKTHPLPLVQHKQGPGLRVVKGAGSSTKRLIETSRGISPLPSSIRDETYQACQDSMSTLKPTVIAALSPSERVGLKDGPHAHGIAAKIDRAAAPTKTLKRPHTADLGTSSVDSTSPADSLISTSLSNSNSAAADRQLEKGRTDSPLKRVRFTPAHTSSSSDACNNQLKDVMFQSHESVQGTTHHAQRASPNLPTISLAPVGFVKDIVRVFSSVLKPMLTSASATSSQTADYAADIAHLEAMDTVSHDLSVVRDNVKDIRDFIVKQQRGNSDRFAQQEDSVVELKNQIDLLSQYRENSLDLV
ncbi:hypothetical protein ACN47E_003176 [Coniothyrium glycines]